MARRFTGFFQNRRAVTPVLSNLLLTVVAVAAMAVATTATYVITTNMRDTMSERVIIEDLWFNNLTESINVSINVYVRNVGKVAVHFLRVYVNHTSQSFSPFTLEINAHSWLNIPKNWVPGSLYYIDIVTTRGTHIGGYYKAP
jgi:hypothetical protein